LYVSLRGTQSTGVVLLDQLVTIDYNARQFNFIETVPGDFMKKLLEIVMVVFQNNNEFQDFNK
jgi:mRNA interferase MazF